MADTIHVVASPARPHRKPSETPPPTELAVCRPGSLLCMCWHVLAVWFCMLCTGGCLNWHGMEHENKQLKSAARSGHAGFSLQLWSSPLCSSTACRHMDKINSLGHAWIEKKKTKSGIKTETEAENETETKMWAVSTSEQGTEGSASVG